MSVIKHMERAADSTYTSRERQRHVDQAVVRPQHLWLIAAAASGAQVIIPTLTEWVWISVPNDGFNRTEVQGLNLAPLNCSASFLLDQLQLGSVSP